MSEGRSRGLGALITAMAAVVVVFGLWMSGVFSSEEEPRTPAIPSRSETTARPPKKPDVPAPQPTPSKLETTPFVATSDTGATVADLGHAKGLRILGRVETLEGAPIADATVTLIHDASVIRSRIQDGAVRAKLKTGKSGAFSFEGLRGSETYIVQATHPNYTTERVAPVDPRIPSTQNPIIRLGSGLAVKGLVLDGQGAPLEGATIEVHDLTIQAPDSLTTAERSANSGADGTYVVPHLKPGLKKVIARRDKHSTDGKNGVMLTATADLEGINFVLSAGETISGVVLDQVTSTPLAKVTVWARPTTLLPRGGAQVPTASVGEDEAGSDEAGAVSERAQRDPHSVLRGGNNPQVTEALNFQQKAFLVEAAETDENGKFVLSGLMAAKYSLSFKCVGFQPIGSYMADAGTEGHSVKMARTWRALGVVLDDETGKPLTDFHLSLSSTPEPPLYNANVRQHFTSPTGEFVYVDLRAGTWYMLAEAEGYAGGKSDAFTVHPELEVPDPGKEAPGGIKEVTGLVIRVHRGATVKGQIRDVHGLPIVGARFEVTKGSVTGPPNPFQALIENSLKGSPRLTGVTDSKGDYTLEAVPAGTYRIRASHADFADILSSEFSCEARGEFSAPLITMLAGATVTGIVRLPDGNPDPKATVALASADQAVHFTRTMNTTASGIYEIKGIPPGTYRVNATQRNGEFSFEVLLKMQQSPSTITLKDGETVKLDF